ncbi:PREDICTED: uncharacterized protein LOC108563760 isoform X2 [Nicrophorus vespilloides]|uniref:Uncharacterized protein LOC108563760 isoform X2 n=1 Tax=Nicrophorus vespilloides TaxID=110193 RepID=A0ABM1MTW3_NICVS|nr:PREDICTED: uncharacterized protein LOC108563760 isoform X2 [Nicrophorus vespilloides]
MTTRPDSYYDNCGNQQEVVNNNALYGTYENDKYDHLRNELLGYARAKSPTQTIALLTTVPQNIAAKSIAGRHAPTRNSLRHSRIVVMHKTGAVPTKHQPPVMRFHKLAKGLIGLQNLIGLAICFISFWLFLWTPNIKVRDNPFWSGIPLLLASATATVLLCCCRKEYPGMKNGSSVYSLKVVSISLSTIAGTACMISSAFAIIHIVSLSRMDCVPMLEQNESCLCHVANGTSPIPFVSRTYHYLDLLCNELNSFFVLLLIFSCAANFIGSVLSLWYVYLHWASRYTYTYSKVHTDSLNPTVISNT